MELSPTTSTSLNSSFIFFSEHLIGLVLRKPLLSRILYRHFGKQVVLGNWCFPRGMNHQSSFTISSRKWEVLKMTWRFSKDDQGFWTSLAIWLPHRTNETLNPKDDTQGWIPLDLQMSKTGFRGTLAWDKLSAWKKKKAFIMDHT